jgi:hypothetical protein
MSEFGRFGNERFRRSLLAGSLVFLGTGLAIWLLARVIDWKAFLAL